MTVWCNKLIHFKIRMSIGRKSMCKKKEINKYKKFYKTSA